MSNNVFKFKLIDMLPFTKEGKNYYRVVCYCSYGFLVNLFVSEEKGNKLKLESSKPTFDMTNFVSVFYDNKANKFAYIIDIK